MYVFGSKYLDILNLRDMLTKQGNERKISKKTIADIGTPNQIQKYYKIDQISGAASGADSEKVFGAIHSNKKDIEYG